MDEEKVVDVVNGATGEAVMETPKAESVQEAPAEVAPVEGVVVSADVDTEDVDDTLDTDDEDLTACACEHEDGVLDVVVMSEEDAKKILEADRIDAIRYIGEAEDTEEIKTLVEKRDAAEARLNKYIEEHSVKTAQARTVGCKKCGSSLAREYLKNDLCPLCGNDLRGPSIIEGEASLRNRLAGLEKRIEKERTVNRLFHGKRLVLRK